VILLSTAIANMMRNGHSFTGPLHGLRDTRGSYPQARTGLIYEKPTAVLSEATVLE
jgi:hypothetical protein